MDALSDKQYTPVFQLVNGQVSTLVPEISVDDPSVTQPTSGSTTFTFTVYLAPERGATAAAQFAR